MFDFKTFDAVQSFNAFIDLILELLPNQSLQRLRKIVVKVNFLKLRQASD